jgi:hypothetical protein
LDVSQKPMKTKHTSNDDIAPGITKTTIAFALLGVIATGATWFRGYQGDLSKMLLDLVGGITLGVGAALLCYTITPRMKPVAQTLMWTLAGYGAYMALASLKPPVSISQVIAIVSGGALYGAFFAGIALAPVNAIVACMLRVKPLSDK